MRKHGVSELKIHTIVNRVGTLTFKRDGYMCNMQNVDDQGWIKVVNRKQKTTLIESSYPKVFQRGGGLTPPPRFQSRPVRRFWNGFDEAGNERWFLVLENGNVLISKDLNYAFG